MEEFIKEIKKLPVRDRFFYWIKQRESIRLKKESGKGKPWTKDPILKNYRFCNVRRMDDKVSRWLLENWYEPYFNHPNILIAVSVARFINKPESLEQIGFPEDDWKEYKKRSKSILRKLQTKQAIFNAAYMVRGNEGQDKLSSVFDYYVESVASFNVKELPVHSMKDTWSIISGCYGFGSFMAGQIVADLRFSLAGIWADKNTWAPIGPGSKRGMNRYLERDLNSPLGQEDFEHYLSKVMATGRKKLDVIITNRIEAHDWQNCFCEFDKYERVINDEGRPKQKYRG